MSMVLLETCRGLYCNIYYYRINKLCIKLVIEISLHYDARSEKHQTTRNCQQYETVQWCHGNAAISSLASRFTTFRTTGNDIEVLSDFNQIWTFSIDVPKSPQYQISRKSFQWELHFYIREDGRTNMTKIIDVFRDLMRKHLKMCSAKKTSSLCTSPFKAVALWPGTDTLIAATIVFNSDFPFITGQADRKTEKQEHMLVMWQVTTDLTGVIIHARHTVNTTKVIFYCVQAQVIQVKCTIISMNALPTIQSLLGTISFTKYHNSALTRRAKSDRQIRKRCQSFGQMPSTEPIQQEYNDEFSIINSWFYLYRSANRTLHQS
jgi:hypothetical protein